MVTVEKKVNEILNRLEKTKAERFPDLAAEKESRDREERSEKKAQAQEMRRREKEEMKKKKEMDELRSGDKGNGGTGGEMDRQTHGIHSPLSLKHRSH